MRDYNYTVVTVRENCKTAITRMIGFDTLVDAVEYVDDRVNVSRRGLIAPSSLSTTSRMIRCFF